MKKPPSRIARAGTAPRKTRRKSTRKRNVARPDSSRTRIYDVVRRIPRGKVATYGQIATIAGLHGQARQVGYAMAAIGRVSAVPWQRVINAQGRISMRSEGPAGSIIQQQLLEQEGVIFRGSRVDLKRFGWKPRRS
ncbi:MAG TPA: MGMT family protein [Gemmatimonadaceae bacterium]|nr:MGMT family protein [Gemmatimonadaceae bacterium]